MITKSNFSILAILIISAITVTPILFNELYVMILWIAFFLWESNKIIRSDNKLLILGCFYVLDCVVYRLLGVSSASMWYCIHAPLLYFAPVLAMIVIDRCDNEQQIRFLFHFLALVIAINIADNIRLTYQIGLKNVTYQLLAGRMEDEGFTGLNLGGTGFVNMAVFYAFTMFMAFLRSNKRKEKLLFLIYVGTSVYFITFCSLKASALLLMLLSMALMYVSVKSKKRMSTIFPVIIIGGGLIFLLRDFIINFFIDIIGSKRITDRLIVFTAEADLEDAGSLMTRSELWLVSIKSWLSGVISFFFGIGDHNWAHFMATADSGIGNHSDLFDVFGRYGIIGALILYSSIKVYYDFLQKKFGVLFKFEIISFIFLLLAMGFTKKIVIAQQAIIILILFPLALRYLYNQGIINKY